MRRIFIILLVFVGSVSVFAGEMNDSITQSQTTRDTIQVQKTGLGYKLMMKDEVLTMDKLGKLLQNNPASAELYKSAKGTSVLLSVMGYAGGFLIGYPLGTALGGGTPNWKMALIGCGIIAIAIPIGTSADKKLLKAVQIYNQDGSTAIRNEKPFDLRLGIKQGGLAMSIRF